jgi:hypothetical protein
MTKGLHKNSLRKVDNPHQWMIDDARMELIQQIKAEIERLKKAQEVSEDKDYAQYELDVACGYDMACDDILSRLSDLEKSEKPNSTNWEQIEKRAKESEKALDYMREHPLTHEQAVEQTRQLKEKLEND